MKHNLDAPMVRPQSRFVSPNEPPVVMRSGRLDDIPDVGKAASPVRMMVVAAILVVAGCVVAVVALQQVGIPWWGTSIVAVALFFWLGKWVLVVLNGDYIATRRIDAAANVERDAIDAQVEVANRHYDTLQMEIQSNQSIAELRIQLEDVRLRQDRTIADMHAAANKLLAAAQQPTMPAEKYVPAQTSHSFITIQDWLLSMYGEDGQADVHPNGQFKGSVPWSKNGSWTMDEKRLVTEGQRGNAPLVVSVEADGRHVGWAINGQYRTLNQAVDWLRQVQG